MQGVRICIVGSEILNGFILDTNTQFFTSEMYKLGLQVKEVRVIADDRETILHTWREYLASSDLVINSGGLGPTDDDLTIDLLCELMQCEWVYDSYAERRLRLFFERRSGADANETEKQITLERALRQVRVPKKAVALKNKVGLAPGIWLKDIRFIGLPGFPIEVKSIWPHALKFISALVSKEVAPTYTLEIPIWGVSESTLFASLPKSKNVEVGVHALPLGCRLFLRSQLQNGIEPIEKQIRQRYAANVVDNPLVSFVDFMRDKNQTIGTVESCTGGLLAKLFTDIAGVSQVYRGSLVTYDNEVKMNLADVDYSIIAKYGAVSPECAWQMAVNARKKLGVDYCIATTGIAGPSGGSKEKPVGTVFIAFSSSDETWVGRFLFPLGRERFRNAVCYSAMLALYQRYIFFGEEDKFAKSDLGAMYSRVK